MSARELAAAINVPANRISEIVRERRSVGADTALRPARDFTIPIRASGSMRRSRTTLSKAEGEVDLSGISAMRLDRRGWAGP
jgi:transcriptional regulator with XRE-family HTH domain